jgi:hypothetical protein
MFHKALRAIYVITTCGLVSRRRGRDLLQVDELLDIRNHDAVAEAGQVRLQAPHLARGHHDVHRPSVSNLQEIANAVREDSKSHLFIIVIVL